MKHILLASFICLFAISTSAADKKKKPIKDKPLADVTVDEAAVAVLKPFDKDGNFEIDHTEFSALAAAFKANPKGPLKQFDLANDGALDDVVDRAGLNNKLGAVPTKQARDAAEKKRQERVAKAKAAAAKAN